MLPYSYDCSFNLLLVYPAFHIFSSSSFQISKMTLNLTLNESKNAFINDSSVEEYEYEYDYDYDESIATFDWSELGPSLFVFGITFIIGILGNCLILVAVIRHTHVKNSPVNVFLASLASADLLLILICLPLKVSRNLIYICTI